MLDSCLWIEHGATPKGIQCYFPAIRCEGNLSDIYPFGTDGGSLESPEKLNRKALGKYAESEFRWLNNSIVRDYDIVLRYELVTEFTRPTIKGTSSDRGFAVCATFLFSPSSSSDFHSFPIAPARPAASLCNVKNIYKQYGDKKAKSGPKKKTDRRAYETSLTLVRRQDSYLCEFT